jgi:FixJ family two-component response regulator
MFVRNPSMPSTVNTSGSPLIAVVDDDGSFRRAIRRLLRISKWQVEVFASAEDFLHSAHLRGTACLILDVRLPGLSGLELQQRLAELNYHIPIIFITAHADDDARSAAIHAGAVDFLQKPFRAEALLRAVRSALERPRGDRPATGSGPDTQR